MDDITNRLVMLNTYTSKMIEKITGEKVEQPIVYIGDPEPVRRKILEGKSFSIAGDGRLTCVLFVMDEMDLPVNICYTKNDVRVPGVWNIIYERNKYDDGLPRAIFMVDDKADVTLSEPVNPLTYKRLKGCELPTAGRYTKKTYAQRMFMYIKGKIDEPPGDPVKYIFNKYGKNQRTARILYTYMRMKDGPYAAHYLNRTLR